MNIETLLHYIKDYSSEDKKIIIRAFEYASIVHKGVKRKSGEDYIIHPLSVACILAEMHADADTICAGLLHDTIEDGENVTKEVIAQVFNPTIALLVDGVTKMKKMEFNDNKRDTDDANTRKIIESITLDVRILIIKLADRLHNMRTIEFHRPEKRIEHAVETMELFVPFASLIGAYNIKLELEDICFKYLEPEKYREMQELVEDINRVYRPILDEIVCTIGQVLNSNSIPFDVKVRVKSLYNLYQKLKTHKSYDEITDLVNIQIMLNDIETCYLLNEQIKYIYDYIEEDACDYIKSPKPNLYSALHTSILINKNIKLQFQLQTKAMHSINSHGLTAYWNLMKNQKRVSPAKKMQDAVKKLQFFRVIEELVSLNMSNAKFNQEIRNNLLSEKINVLTPKGDIIELPSGSTPLDFAYKIHTDIGNNYVVAIVNGNPVPIDYKLKNRDVVNIIADKNYIGPKRDMTSFCKTEHAKRKIKELKKNGYMK